MVDAVVTTLPRNFKVPRPPPAPNAMTRSPPMSTLPVPKVRSFVPTHVQVPASGPALTAPFWLSVAPTVELIVVPAVKVNVAAEGPADPALLRTSVPADSVTFVKAVLLPPRARVETPCLTNAPAVPLNEKFSVSVPASVFQVPGAVDQGPPPSVRSPVWPIEVVLNSIVPTFSRP